VKSDSQSGFLLVEDRGAVRILTMNRPEKRNALNTALTQALLDGLRARVKAKDIVEPEALLDALKAEMIGRLQGLDRELHLEPGDVGSPNVWLFVGVNGVGKTTTTINLAAAVANKGFKTLLIDLDPQANSTMSYVDQRSITRSMFDVMVSEELGFTDVIVPFVRPRAER